MHDFENKIDYNPIKIAEDIYNSVADYDRIRKTEVFKKLEFDEKRLKDKIETEISALI